MALALPQSSLVIFQAGASAGIQPGRARQDGIVQERHV